MQAGVSGSPVRPPAAFFVHPPRTYTDGMPRPTRRSATTPALRMLSWFPDDDRVAMLGARFTALASEIPEVVRLEGTLLRHGGIGVIFPPHHEMWLVNLARVRRFYADLLRRGAHQDAGPDAPPVTRIRGAASRCHANAARWSQRTGGDIITGFAASADGEWREHTWGRTADGVIVESTEPAGRVLRHYPRPRRAA